MERQRLIIAGTAIGITLLILWHRSTVNKERQRAASEERRRLGLENAA